MGSFDCSGSWFGGLPSGWCAIKLKYLASTNNGLTYSPNDVVDSGTPVLRSNNIRNGKLDKSNLVYVDISVSERSMAHKGDVLICSRNGSKKLIGKNALIDEDGMAFGAFMMIARPHCNSSYFYYILNSQVFDYYLPTYLTSTVNQLTTSNCDNMVVPFTPERQEQKKIVEFLDSKTAEIDVLIDKLRRQVELMERYRRELIAHTVTRGLDPDVPMRDSGVDWIGRIPAHWDLEKQKRVLRHVVRTVGSSWSDFKLLSLGKKGVVERDINSGKGKFPASFEDYQEVIKGDIVMCLFDMDETPRTVGLSEIPGMITGAYDVFEVAKGDRRYINYWLHALDNQKLWRIFYRSLRKTITAPRFLAIPIALPPEPEQQKISDYLDAAMLDLNSVLTGINRQMELLGKYRKQVINDAVTGKVLVEGAE